MIRGALIRLRRLGPDARGVAALEFALVLPVLVTIYFGMVEATRIADTGRKLTHFARTLADLSGRAENASTTVADMTAITGAAAVILRPLDVSSVQIVVNAMGVESISGTLYGGVCSSYPQNARPVLQINGTGGLPATPATYQFDGARYVLAEVSMAYTPLVGAKLYTWIFGPKGLTFTRQIPWAQRTTTEIIMPGGAACPNYS